MLTNNRLLRGGRTKERGVDEGRVLRLLQVCACLNAFMMSTSTVLRLALCIGTGGTVTTGVDYGWPSGA
eukprot:4460771-Alexandrium_andersonii.AAC.1